MWVFVWCLKHHTQYLIYILFNVDSFNLYLLEAKDGKYKLQIIRFICYIMRKEVGYTKNKRIYLGWIKLNKYKIYTYCHLLLHIL